MRILLFGGTGQVGWELRRCLAVLGEVHAPGSQTLDLTHLTALRGEIQALRPHLIVNAAAYTAVDRAEQEPQLAFTINAAAPLVIAEAAHRIGAACVHYSTDYVFDGRKGAPYTEEDAPNPLNVYGESKRKGEEGILQAVRACLILRTSWVYSLRRTNFVTRVLGQARGSPVLRAVTDQTGSPTWSADLARWTVQLLEQGKADMTSWLADLRGIYHLAGKGSASRFDLARAVLELDPSPQEHVFQELQPSVSADFPSPAQRPAYSALDCRRVEAVFGVHVTDWRQSLALALRGGTPDD